MSTTIMAVLDINNICIFTMLHRFPRAKNLPFALAMQLSGENFFVIGENFFVEGSVQSAAHHCYKKCGQVLVC